MRESERMKMSLRMQVFAHQAALIADFSSKHYLSNFF